MYIHGTNNLKEIGQSASLGCVNLRPNDIVELFDKALEGMHVYIY